MNFLSLIEWFMRY